MRSFRDDKGRLLLCLDFDEYRELQDVITNLERVSFDQLLLKGLDNCILNHLGGATIAVLDPELNYFNRKGKES